MYAGDKELANGARPETVLRHLEDFVTRKRRTIGAVPLAYVSIKVSPARLGLMHRIGYTNLIIERRLLGNADLAFVDLTRRMTARRLHTFSRYYSDDPLHMNREGYRLLGKCISEYLDALAVSATLFSRAKVCAVPA